MPKIADVIEYKLATVLGRDYARDFAHMVGFRESIAVTGEGVAVTTGTGKYIFRAPRAFALREVRASLGVVGGGVLEVDVKKNGVSVFTTTLTVDAGEKTSVTAAVPAVIGSSLAEFANDDEISIDVIQASGSGLKVLLLGGL